MDPALHIERRVLAEILVNSAALALADDLEIEDFVHPHHRVVFTELRNLHASSADVSPLAVHDAIVMHDLAYEKHLGQTITLDWFLKLLGTTESYGELLDVVFPADLRLLRRIALERKNA